MLENNKEKRESSGSFDDQDIEVITVREKVLIWVQTGILISVAGIGEMEG